MRGPTDALSSGLLKTSAGTVKPLKRKGHEAEGPIEVDLDSMRGVPPRAQSSRPRATETVTGCLVGHGPPYSHGLYSQTRAGWRGTSSPGGHRPPRQSRVAGQSTGCQWDTSHLADTSCHTPPYLPLFHPSSIPPTDHHRPCRHSTLHSPSFQCSMPDRPSHSVTSIHSPKEAMSRREILGYTGTAYAAHGLVVSCVDTSKEAQRWGSPVE